jgi:hypothetical protein
MKQNKQNQTIMKNQKMTYMIYNSAGISSHTFNGTEKEVEDYINELRSYHNNPKWYYEIR